MSKQFIDGLLDNCHQKIIEGEPYGVVEALQSIKIRVHNEAVVAKINEFERDATLKYELAITNNERLSENSIETQRKNSLEYMKLSRKYLSFYDKLSKEHELF
ncbi:MAG: hypothetical protein DRN27_09955 [Thermoplasmata archaeon]|nr:MAG: hypothetical protein DRN27_09955 [Thermoplasmata archaeon]